jgi:hypothetical protein
VDEEERIQFIGWLTTLQVYRLLFKAINPHNRRFSMKKSQCWVSEASNWLTCQLPCCLPFYAIASYWPSFHSSKTANQRSIVCSRMHSFPLVPFSPCFTLFLLQWAPLPLQTGL